MEEKRIVEYVKEPEKQPLNALGLAGTLLGGGALVGVAGQTLGNVVSRYFGNSSPAAVNNAAASVTPIVTALATAAAPYAASMAHAACAPHGHVHGVEYVTKDELKLVREVSERDNAIAAKDAVIAKLESINYTNEKVQEAVEKVSAKYDAQIAGLNNKVCNLETHAAVTATAFEDYKQFVNRTFVHQPKARMRDCIVTTQDNCCCCAPPTSAPAI